MATIRLEGLEFYAYHGFYQEEQKLGNKYSVEISMSLDVSAAAESDDLAGTINYEKVYLIVSKVMSKQVKLLEHLAHKINQDILNTFIQLDSVETVVSKHNPPLKGICKAASVTLESKR